MSTEEVKALVEELRYGAEYGCDADLIERAADAIEELVADLGDADAMTEMWRRKYEALQKESDSRTIYGYPIDKLLPFAEMCRRNGVQESDLKQAAWNLELAVRAVINAQVEIFQTEAEVTAKFTTNFAKAYAEMIFPPVGNTVKIPKITLEEPKEDA